MKTKDPFVISIGQQLKQARINKSLKVEDIIKDKKVGVTRSVYFYYESGDVEMPMSRFVYLCDKLGLDYTQVMTKARKDAK